MVDQKLIQEIVADLDSTLVKIEGIDQEHFDWYNMHVKDLGGFCKFVEWMLKVVDALKLENVGTILDLGAGYCEHAYVLSRLGNKVIACEPRERYVCHIDWLNKKKKNSMKILVGDSDKIDLGDSLVDVVYMNETISHMRDFESGLKEIRRVLKPNGRIIIMDTDRNTWQSLKTVHVQLPKTDKKFYVPRRRKAIQESFDQKGISYTDVELDYLAENTKGWTFADIEKHFIDSDSKQDFRERFKPPYKWIDPESGQYMENLYTPKEVMEILRKNGFVCREIVLQPPPRLHWLPDSVSYWWKCPGKFIIEGVVKT